MLENPCVTAAQPGPRQRARPPRAPADGGEGRPRVGWLPLSSNPTADDSHEAPVRFPALTLAFSNQFRHRSMNAQGERRPACRHHC